MYLKARLEPSNAPVQWTVARRQLEGGDTSIFFPQSGKKMQTSLVTRSKKSSSAFAGLDFLLCTKEARTIKCNSPVDCGSPPARWRRLLYFLSAKQKENANEPRHPLQKSAIFDRRLPIFTFSLFTNTWGRFLKVISNSE